MLFRSPYKLLIEKENEEVFRRAAKLLDDRIKTYSSNYAYKDKQDLVAMVALEHTIQLLQNERLISDKETTLAKKLSEIDIALTEFLNNSQPDVL